jgi:hypothetical protein
MQLEMRARFGFARSVTTGKGGSVESSDDDDLTVVDHDHAA